MRPIPASFRRLHLGCCLLLLLPGLLGPAPARAQQLEAFSDGFEELVRRVDPAVVQIFATSYAASPVSGAGLVSRQENSGSGVLVDPTGYIVTNAHVVTGARRVQVVLSAGTSREEGRSVLRRRGEVLGATVVGIDEETDLAVLKVRGEDLPWLPLGDSERLRPGEIVFAFGSPLGLENSVSLGVVSATARQLRQEDPMIYIQTDAPINPGNSGGPLVNTAGEVVGINSLILSQSGGSEGLGFAAPSNIVRTIYEQIRDRGRVQRGVLGVHAQTVTPTLRQALALGPEDRVVLGDVYPGGPADRAGLRPGDVIRSLDGKTMENARQLDVNVYGKPVGGSVEVGVVRDGGSRTVTVEVVERPDDPLRFLALANPKDHLVDGLGVLGLTLDGRLLGMLPGARRPAGVVVAATSGAASTIWGDSFLPGDIIYALGGRKVTDLQGLRRLVDGLHRGDVFVVQVERQGQLRYLAFEME